MMYADNTTDCKSPFVAMQRLSLPAQTTSGDIVQYVGAKPDAEVLIDVALLPNDIQDIDQEWLNKAIVRHPIF